MDSLGFTRDSLLCDSEVPVVNFPFFMMPSYERMHIDQYYAKYNVIKYGGNASRQIELAIELFT